MADIQPLVVCDCCWFLHGLDVDRKSLFSSCIACCVCYKMAPTCRGTQENFVSLVGGTLAILSIARVLREGANPEYPREVAGQFVTLFGREWEIVDLPWPHGSG